MNRTHYAKLKAAADAMALFAQFGSWSHARLVLHIRALDRANEHLQMVEIDRILDEVMA
jgi:hypothetical protein